MRHGEPAHAAMRRGEPAREPPRALKNIKTTNSESRPFDLARPLEKLARFQGGATKKAFQEPCLHLGTIRLCKQARRLSGTAVEVVVQLAW